MEQHHRKGAGAELLFALAAIRLVIGIVLDSAYNIASFVFFLLFLRGRERERMRRIILGTPACAALLFAALLVAGGCSASKMVDDGNSNSLQGQLDQLNWSIQALADQSDSRKSLEQDLEDLKMEPDWKENMQFDIENLFLMPDGKKSMEEDLESLKDDDWRKHGLKETFQMLGW